MKLPQKNTAAIAVAILAAMISPCGAGTYTTGPIADAFVATGPTGNLNGDNFGAAGSLTVEAGALAQGQFQSVMEFNLSGAVTAFNAQYGAGQWTVQSVALQLTSSAHGNAMFNPVAAGQFGLSLMQNNSWAEGTGTGGAPTTDGISFTSLTGTYINAAADQGLGTFSFAGGSSGTASYTMNLASGLIGDVEGGGDASLRMFAADNNVSYLFTSREGAPNGPELVITAVPEPDTLLLGMAGAAVVWAGQFVRRVRGR